MTRYERIAEQLDQIGADLDEASFDLLQQAAADGATARPPADKTLIQARRAVEKAADLLRQLEDSSVRGAASAGPPLLARTCDQAGSRSTTRNSRTGAVALDRSSGGRSCPGARGSRRAPRCSDGRGLELDARACPR